MGIFQFKKIKKEAKGEKVVKEGAKRGIKKEVKKEVKKISNNGKQDSETKATSENKTGKIANPEKNDKNTSGLSQREQSEIAYRVLTEPWITERSHNLMALNKYVFKVAEFSNRNQIKKAVEELYNVRVIKMNIINIPSKKRNFARKAGWKSGYKKAIVTLKEGDKIELFQGA